MRIHGWLLLAVAASLFTTFHAQGQTTENQAPKPVTIGSSVPKRAEQAPVTDAEAAREIASIREQFKNLERRLAALEARLNAGKSAARPPARIGQIFLCGNEKTPQKDILGEIDLYPGQLLTSGALKKAEKELKPMHATIEVLDNDSASEFKDIMVRVKETTGAGKPDSASLEERIYSELRSTHETKDLDAGYLIVVTSVEDRTLNHIQIGRFDAKGICNFRLKARSGELQVRPSQKIVLVLRQVELQSTWRIQLDAVKH